MQDVTVFDQIDFVWIEEEGSHRLSEESRIVRNYLEDNDIECRLFTRKKISRRALSITHRTPVIGSIPSVHGALRHIGIDPPIPNDYPDVLQQHLRRKIKRTTLAHLRHRLDSSPIFVKPALALKKFIGRVVYDDRDLPFSPYVSEHTEVWFSEIVTWKTEYRIYVIQGKIVAANHYSGDPTWQVDFEVVEAAIKAFEDQDAPSAYGIDFGVLESGETALVEVNDAYALGAYGISGEDYTRLVLTRWKELTQHMSIFTPLVKDIGP